MHQGIVTPLVDIDTIFHTHLERFLGGPMLRDAGIFKFVESIAQADVVALRATEGEDSRDDAA